MGVYTPLFVCGKTAAAQCENTVPHFYARHEKGLDQMKKILSVLLALAMLLSMTTGIVLASDERAAFVTISLCGEIVTGKGGEMVAGVKVELTGESCTLDDVFTAVHDTYYDGGAQAGYSSAIGSYGPYVTKLWGDESGSFGYQVNGGSEVVYGPDYVVENGDVIDAYILESYYPDSENYASFDINTKEVLVNEEFTLTLKEGIYDEAFNLVMTPCEAAAITVNGAETEFSTDDGGIAALSFDAPGTYIVSAVKSKTVEDKTVTAITAPVCVVTVKLPDACITVPSDAKLFVGSKTKNFVSFTEIEPAFVQENTEEGTTSCYFSLTNNKIYNYRVSGEDYVTCGGSFKKTANYNYEITRADLLPEGKTKTTVEKDVSLNSGYNVADIYLNISPEGFLRLRSGETYQLVSERAWQTVDSTTNNYFIEPDFHYSVIDEYSNESDVVTVDENGLITAQKSGTAIVLVSYDAINVKSAAGGPFFGAIWPENTGVFVIETDGEESTIDSGITINEGVNTSENKLSADALDSEHDVIYFIGENGEYTFTPKTEGVIVSVLNPDITDRAFYNGFKRVDKNADKSFTVPLTEGRNILKLEKDSKAEYQVITAKKVNVTVNGGEAVSPGDEISIVFDTLYHPAHKLAGVYNMAAIPVYTSVSGYEDELVGGFSQQYKFASTASAQTVSNVLKKTENAWGAVSFSKKASLAVPEDFNYDTFSLKGGSILVTGYGDPYGSHRAITLTGGKDANFNALPRTAYLGRLPDIEIPVKITDSELDKIVLNTENVKTDYFDGEEFNTENLTVTAVYKDGKTQAASNYTVTPKILTKDTKEVTVTYREKTAVIPVNVTASSSGSTSDSKIKVYFTLYGDSKHGETGGVHTYKNKELEKWIDKTTITVEKGSFAIDVVTKALSAAGIAYENPSGNYIESIKGLGESDNGPLSGWMYLLNNKYPNKGISEQAVKNGDSIIFHYTDDYTREKVQDSTGGSSGKKPNEEAGDDDKKTDEPIAEITNPFEDVKEDDWFYGAVLSAFAKGIFKGTGEKMFSPNMKVSRAMLVTMLYNIAGAPETEEQSFDDVEKDAYYAKAVSWASKNGIVHGVSEKVFAPQESITREQLVTILYNYSILSGEAENKTGTAQEFADFEEVSQYAKNAVLWAAMRGILKGNEKGFIMPKSGATRAETAAILTRF